MSDIIGKIGGNFFKAVSQLFMVLTIFNFEGMITGYSKLTIAQLELTFPVE
jgi:hypothetical protein